LYQTYVRYASIVALLFRRYFVVRTVDGYLEIAADQSLE